MIGGSATMERAWQKLLDVNGEQVWTEGVQWAKTRYFRWMLGSGQVFQWDGVSLCWKSLTLAQLTTILLDGAIISFTRNQ